MSVLYLFKGYKDEPPVFTNKSSCSLHNNLSSLVSIYRSKAIKSPDVLSR